MRISLYICISKIPVMVFVLVSLILGVPGIYNSICSNPYYGYASFLF